MNSDKAKINKEKFICKIVKNLRPGSEGENIFEDEKEQRFDNIPLISPSKLITNKVVQKFDIPAKRSSTESSIASSRQSSSDASDDSMSMCKTVSQDREDEPWDRPTTTIRTICETDEVKLVKRSKGVKDSWKAKAKNKNLNMLYPKNLFTYSAYVKNVINQLWLNIDSKKSASKTKNQKQFPPKQQTNSGAVKSGTLGKVTKINSESNINEENHPSLRRRCDRLFISVPK